MLIECLTQLRNSQTRQVSMFGTLYEFIPLADGRLVAEVTDATHAQQFLSKRSYREFTDTLPGPSPTLQPNNAPKAPAKPKDPPPPPPPPPAETPSTSTSTAPAGDQPPPPPPTGDGTDGSQTANEVNAKAQALLSSTPIAIKKQVDKHPPEKAVLKAAIAIENAAKQPRQHVLACLTGALSALEG